MANFAFLAGALLVVCIIDNKASFKPDESVFTAKAGLFTAKAGWLGLVALVGFFSDTHILISKT